MAKISRKYRLSLTPEQERELAEQVRLVTRVWNAFIERHKLKGQRSLLECFSKPSGINGLEREKRKAYGRMMRAKETFEALGSKPDANPERLAVLEAEYASAMAAHEAAEAVVAAILPSKDAPFAPPLASSEVTALRNAAPELRQISSALIHGTARTFQEALRGFYQSVKKGLPARPPGFRAYSESETLTMALQISAPILWRRSAKAQAGLLRAGKSTHSRYGCIRLPGWSSDRPLKFRLGTYGLPTFARKVDAKTDPKPVVRITRDKAGRWFVCFAVDDRTSQPGGKTPLGVDLGVAVPVALSVPARAIRSAQKASRPLVGPMSQPRLRHQVPVEYVQRAGIRIKQRIGGVSRGLRLHDLPQLTKTEEERMLRIQRRIARNRQQRQICRDPVERDLLRSAYGQLLREHNKYIQRLDDRRRDWREQTTTRLARRSREIYVEALALKNMTRSASGTVDVPGSRVSQKRGLNRSLLAASLGHVRERLEQKVTARGGTLVQVPSHYTSQECSACHAVDSASRDGRRYRCTSCGFEAHADTNAANNILARGLGCLDAAKKLDKNEHGTDGADGMKSVPKQAGASRRPLQSRPRSHQ